MLTEDGWVAVTWRLLAAVRLDAPDLEGSGTVLWSNDPLIILLSLLPPPRPFYPLLVRHRITQVWKSTHQDLTVFHAARNLFSTGSLFNERSDDPPPQGPISLENWLAAVRYWPSDKDAVPHDPTPFSSKWWCRKTLTLCCQLSSRKGKKKSMLAI